MWIISSALKIFCRHRISRTQHGADVKLEIFENRNKMTWEVKNVNNGLFYCQNKLYMYIFIICIHMHICSEKACISIILLLLWWCGIILDIVMCDSSEQLHYSCTTYFRMNILPTRDFEIQGLLKQKASMLVTRSLDKSISVTYYLLLL